MAKPVGVEHALASQLRAGALVSVARDPVIERVRRARSRVWLVSPFLSLEVAQLLSEAAMVGAAPDRRLLTALTTDAVERGVLDPAGLCALSGAGFELASIPNMHAKLVITDERFVLVGSGNLTTAGWGGGNVELGVVLAPRQRSAAARHFKHWWSHAEPIAPTDIASYARAKRSTRKRGRGRAHGRPLRVPPGRELGRQRDERRPATADRGYWLKMLYHRPDRDLPAWWTDELTWISDRHTFNQSGEPVRRPTYSVGDLLVLYLVGPSVCPAICEVIREPEFDPDRVRREATDADAAQWAWLTEIRVVHRTDVASAPGLEEIGVARASVRQHGHIRLSPDSYRRALHALRGRGVTGGN